MTLRTGKTGAAVLAALALCAGAAGCGGDSGDDAAEKPPPPANPEDFPKSARKTLAQLKKELGGEGPVLAPSVSQFAPGENRLGFGLFDRSRAQIADAPAAIYVAPAGGGKARGPMVARYESLAVKVQFQSRTVQADPDAATSLYVADVNFAKPGRYDVLAVVRLDGRLVAAGNAGGPVAVAKSSRVPDVGDQAPVVKTATTAESRGNIEAIDTRKPPSTMHEKDFANVVGRRPAILLFATPALCQSRVCGPVVDIAAQVKAHRGEEAEFIHQEIFVDNEVDKGFRTQVLEWNLPTEPWVFAVDRRGRVAARIEGAFSARELERAVDAAVKG